MSADDDLESVGLEISKLVGAIFDGTADVVKKLRKMSDRSADIAEKLGNIAEMIQNISDLQHAAAVAVAEIGAEMISAERIPDDDEESEEEEDEDDDEDSF